MSQSTADSLDRENDVLSAPLENTGGAPPAAEFASRRQSGRTTRWTEASTPQPPLDLPALPVEPELPPTGPDPFTANRVSPKDPAPIASSRNQSVQPSARKTEADKHSFLSNLLAPPGVLGAINLSESQREPAFREELLTQYGQRLKLLGTLTMATLPACVAVYAWLLPEVLRQVVPVYTVLFVYALLMRTLVGCVRSLVAYRLITLVSYACFSMGAAVVIALVGDHNIGDNNALLYSSHNHIILSALLLPFTVWECGVVAAIVVGSLAWAGWWSLPKELAAVYASYLYLLCTTTLFVLCVTHFQCLLRRRAFDDAFDLVRSNDKLQALSFMDALTGGYNRRYLEQTLAIEIARAARFNRPLSVMMFDLDNFKSVNDSRGHAAGDEVLREVWQAALGALREVDAAARYGGDEFSIVLPETDELAAYGVAERLQAAVRYRLHARFGPESPEGHVTVSIGIVTARPGDVGAPSPDNLIDAADERLYEAKRRGKNLVAA